MTHTLFDPGKWEAKGFYSDGNNNVYQAEGKGEITHTKTHWVNDVYLYIGELENKITNRYEIVPFPEGKDFTTFVAINPAVGRTSGRLMFMMDSYIWNFFSDDGRYMGYEFMARINDTSYITRGFAFWSNKKLFSWAIELRKIG